MHINHVGISGGKDSQALMLWAIMESGLPLDSIRITFCNTHNEDPLTYEHVRMLGEFAKKHGVATGIEWLEPALDEWRKKDVVAEAIAAHPQYADDAFTMLAVMKRRFPSRKAQFCTDHLKIRPTGEWIKKMTALGHTLTMMSGVRADESEARSKLPERDPAHMTKWGVEVWRPLLKWTIADVFAISAKYGLPMNPLYAMGARRVGCFPCVNCAKREVRLVAQHRPEKIDHIRLAEKIVGKGRRSNEHRSFFPSKTVTANFRRGPYINDEGKECWYTTIDDVVEWSKTARGGKQMALRFDDEDKHTACSARYGQCE